MNKYSLLVCGMVVGMGFLCAVTPALALEGGGAIQDVNSRTSSTAATGSCSGGGRSGTCQSPCASTADIITPATGCAAGMSCCAGSAAGAGGSQKVGGMVDIVIANPLAYSTVDDFLSHGILSWLRGIVATIALVFFVIGALLYMLGGADESNIKRGKSAMTAASLGLLLALAAPTFLQEIYALFGGPSVSLGPTVVQVALNVLRLLLSIVGIVVLIVLVVSGLTYMTSGGDDTRAKAAKNMATGAVIGLVLAMAALIIVRQIAKLFL